VGIPIIFIGNDILTRKKMKTPKIFDDGHAYVRYLLHQQSTSGSNKAGP
jgi:hypothetical protein